MAQYDFGTIDPNTKSGTALASDLNSWRNAVHSTHSAATAPSYLVAGMLWADTTSANYELKMYDGAQWIPVAILDATNNVARVAIDAAETSYITSTTNAQIRHVIANTDVFTTRSTGIQFNIASPVIADNNNNELISFTTTASAVNQVSITNAATGNPPTISTSGGDTNINLLLTAKGTGIVYTYSETAATNTVIDVARLESRSTGTPAAGIGAGLLFAAETAANNFEIGARIEAVATDVTAASEDFDIVFKTMAAGAAAAERMRIGSTGLVNVSSLAIGGTTVTATATELNILDGVTATTAELNILDGVIATTAEINFLDTVSSNIQTQLNAKAALASPALTGTPTAPTAAAGTNTTQLATTAFVQTALGGAASYTLLGTIATTSGNSATLSGLTLTSYSQLIAVFNGVSQTAVEKVVRVGTTTAGILSGLGSGGTSGFRGHFVLDLSTGVFSATLGSSSGGAASTAQATPFGGNCAVTNASTSITFSTDGTFDAGSILVYGVK